MAAATNFKAVLGGRTGGGRLYTTKEICDLVGIWEDRFLVADAAPDSAEEGWNEGLSTLSDALIEHFQARERS